METIVKNRQYYKFCFYGFLRNLRFFDAFFILFLIEKDLSFTAIGILYALRELVINISEIPSGIVADALGRRNSLLASFLVYILSFVVFYFSNRFAAFACAFIFYGLAEAFRSGTHKAMIMDYLKQQGRETQKIKYYGHTRSWSQMGAGVSALLAGLIVFYSGEYTSIFLYSTIPYLLNFLLLLSYPAYLNRTSQDRINWKNEISLSIQSFLQTVKKAEVLKIMNTTAFHSAYLKAVKDYIQPMLVSVAALIPLLIDVAAEKRNGIIIGIVYFFIFLTTSAASKNASRFVGKQKAATAFISLVIGLSFGMLCGLFFQYEYWVLALFAFIAVYVVENIRKPILTGFIADEVPNQNLTAVLSALTLWKTIITAAIALSVGILSDAFGIGTALLAVSSILVLLLFFFQILGTFQKNKV